MSDHEYRLQRIEDKLDRVDQVNADQNEVLVKIEEVLKVNTQSLSEHMRRTELNEDRIRNLEDKELRDRSFIKGSMWAIGILWIVMTFAIGMWLKEGRYERRNDVKKTTVHTEFPKRVQETYYLCFDPSISHYVPCNWAYHG
jgi:hypothetical protein